MKSLLGLSDLGGDDLRVLIDSANGIRADLDGGAAPRQSLLGRCVANVFFEPSTRTRLSFDLAAQRLGAHVITFNPATSSASKGESLSDSVSTVVAIGADVLVVRHAEEGIPHSIAEWTGMPVVNAGDGVGEHPTQALLDCVTLVRRFGGVDGLRVGIVGDVRHSRVANSLMQSLPKLGAVLTLVGPEDWIPAPYDGSIGVSNDLDEVVGDLDVAYMLRVQTERGAEISEDYAERFGLDTSRATALGPNGVVMHPGPLNRGVEITDEVADSSRSLVLEQVRNAVPTRMAVLHAVAGGET